MIERMLEELGEIITGNTPSKKIEKFWDSEDIYFIKPDIIRSNEVNVISETNEYISEAARTSARVVTKNTILVTCIGSIGKIGIVSEGEYAFNQQINAIVPNGKVNSRYLAYNLLFNKPKLVAIANTSVVPIINKNQFGKVSVKIENDIGQQLEIVNVLDKVYDIIKLREKEMLLLDQLIRARFVEMFGDPVLNEKRWEIKSLLDMGTCKNGMNFHYGDSGIKIKCLGVGDFKDLSVIENTKELLNISLNEMPSEEYLLKDGDIVFVRSNGNKSLVGRSLAIYPGKEPTTFSGFCIRYRKFDESIIIPYLLRVLKADSIREKLTGRGANIQNLNQQILRTVMIPVPPIELQEQFADFVDQVNKSKVILPKPPFNVII